MKKPGASLLVVGLLLLFIVRPIVDQIPAIGGALERLAFFVSLFGILGGGYLLLRSITGIGR